MSENLLQFIWKHRLYASLPVLKTIEGDEVIILHPGQLNVNAGPDFLEARLKIGHTLWAGNIELHLKSSDWNKHEHQENPAYSKLIMHVVYEHDSEIETMNDTTFPTLELKRHIDKTLLLNFENLMHSKTFIPCEELISQVNELTLHQQITRTLMERLEEKSLAIQTLLKRYKNNWQEVFYVQLARGFGLHINQDAFEQLAIQTPLQLLGKHKNNLLQVEALLFGQAGFLFDYFDETYPMLLQSEYEYLKKLHTLHPMEKHQWKFLRLRPANFPTLRIAQFARLIVDSNHLFSKVLSAETIKEIEQLFKINVSDYWLVHYNFLEKSIERNKSLGKTFVHTLIINVIVPMLFIYGKLQGKEAYCEKSIRLLEELPAEKNSIISTWKEIGIKTDNAADTQGLLQLKKKYCDAKNCLECSIGYAVLRK